MKPIRIIIDYEMEKEINISAQNADGSNDIDEILVVTGMTMALAAIIASISKRSGANLEAGCELAAEELKRIARSAKLN